MDLSKIKAIHIEANGLRKLINYLLDRITLNSTVFIKDEKDFIILNNSFFQLRDNFIGILEELNTSLKIMDLELINSKDWIRLDVDEIKMKLRIMNTECQKIIKFLDEYQKFDDELTYIFEQFFHKKVKELSFEDFQRGEYLNAVRNVFIEINDQVKEKYKNKTGKELDGKSLMVEALHCKNKNALLLNSLSSDSERNIQDGYRWLFAGSILAIRNPSAHRNIELNKKEAFHFLTLGSDLFHAIDKLK